MLIVLTGQTASGKDTIVAELLKKFPNFKKVVTTTSRKIRTGELEGVDYHFISEERFRQKIANGDFLEYVEYGGNLYGTQKQALSGIDLVWRIDPSRAAKVRDLLKENLLVIYISADENTVLQRLRQRNIPAREIEKRMEDDRKIWQDYKNNYDYIVENTSGKLDETIDKIVKIIESHKFS